MSHERMTLATALRRRTWRLAGAGGPFAPGQLLLLGGPGWETFEIVQVTETGSAPEQTESCPVRRCVLRTLGNVHPAGTPVTAISVERLPIEE
jgi:hypothetical protein